MPHTAAGRIWGVVPLFALVFSVGCSSNAIEGRVHVVRTTKGLAGVEVLARAETDIKEEKARAEIRAKTDASGRFKMRGLLPKNYVLRVADVRWDSEPMWVTPPPKGTLVPERPLNAYPIPRAEEIVVLSPPGFEPQSLADLARPLREFERIEATADVGGLGRSVTLHKADDAALASHALQLADASLLFYYEGRVPEFGPLLNPTGSKRPAFPNGRYYRIAEMNAPSNPRATTWVRLDLVMTPREAEAGFRGSGVRMIELDQLGAAPLLFVTEQQQVSQWESVTRYPLAGFVLNTGEPLATAPSGGANEREQDVADSPAAADRSAEHAPTEAEVAAANRAMIERQRRIQAGLPVEELSEAPPRVEFDFTKRDSAGANRRH